MLRTRKSPLNFKSRPDLDHDLVFKQFLSLSNTGNSAKFTCNSISRCRILMNFFLKDDVSWSVSQTKKHSIGVLLPVVIGSRDFLTEFSL